MNLERGLFCVFPAPGSTPPDPVTGLPGVRITPPPSARPDANGVAIKTFRPDGWLENTAALIHVTEPKAQILVSIYQATNAAPGSAPRLQVLRLSAEETAAPMPPPAPMPEAAPNPVTHQPEPSPEIVAHIQRTGDVAGRFGERIGTPGSKMWIEGFGIAPHGGIDPNDLEYQGVLGRGWLSPWVEAGRFCGSRGMALPLLGIKVRLKGEAAERFECTYSASFVDGSTVGPVAMGESCEAESLAALESFIIELRPRDATQAARPRSRAARR